MLGLRARCRYGTLPGAAAAVGATPTATPSSSSASANITAASGLRGGGRGGVVGCPASVPIGFGNKPSSRLCRPSAVRGCPSRRSVGALAKVHVQPEEISYSAVIDDCSARGAMKEATGWLEEMAASAFKPNVFAFNAVIAGFARHGTPVQAAGWLDRMVAEGLQPNLLSYNAVIDSCAKVGDYEGAVRWFHTMLKSGIRPDTRSYNAVLRSCARAGHAEGAVQWLEKLRAAEPPAEPNEISYNSAIRSCANARPRREAEAAERLFKEMRASGLFPNWTTLTALGQAVGHQRRDDLCLAYGVNVRMAASRARTPRDDSDTYGYSKRLRGAGAGA